MCDYCSWIDSIRAKTKLEIDSIPVEPVKPPPKKDPVVVVHGGAGRIPFFERLYMLDEVKNAAVKAYAQLIRGYHCLDAVETAISQMESKKYFNCAWGGARDINGEVVSDAAIMDNNFNAGSVGAIRDIEHPISLARMVMQQTDHVLLAETGAQKFAISMGVPILPPGSLIPQSTQILSDNEGEEEEEAVDDEEYTVEDIRRYDPSNYNSDAGPDDLSLQSLHSSTTEPKYIKHTERKLAQCKSARLKIDAEIKMQEKEARKVLQQPDMEEPTSIKVAAVGAVAYDQEGRLASGTSTAGDMKKIIGWMSPTATVIGCGIFADSGGCASVSGAEKEIYVHAPARRIVDRLTKNESVESALNNELDLFEKKTKQSYIGGIALDAEGKPAVAFKCSHFPWAYCHLGRVYYGFRKNETLSEQIDGLARPLDCICVGDA